MDIGNAIDTELISSLWFSNHTLGVVSRKLEVLRERDLAWLCFAFFFFVLVDSTREL